MASILRLPRSVYLDIEAGRKDLTIAAMTRLVERLSTNPIWLLTGRGPAVCDPDFVYETCVGRIIALEEKVITLENFSIVFAALRNSSSHDKKFVESDVSTAELNKNPLFELTNEQWAQLLRAYESSMAVGKIALDYQVTRSTVLAILSDAPRRKGRSATIPVWRSS